MQGSPLGRPFGIFVDRARVTMLGLVPSIARAWRASNCMQVRSPINCKAFPPLSVTNPDIGLHNQGLIALSYTQWHADRPTERQKTALVSVIFPTRHKFRPESLLG